MEPSPRTPHIFQGLVLPLRITHMATDWALSVTVNNSRVTVVQMCITERQVTLCHHENFHLHMLTVPNSEAEILNIF